MAWSDYILAVAQHYRTKRDCDDLSSRLSRPTPANLRDECVIVFERGFNKKDEKALADFFGPAGDEGAYLKAIKGIDIDRFRPLVTYLKNDLTNSPEDKNIELLSWLINFEPRPHKSGRTYDTPGAGPGEESEHSERDKNEVGKVGPVESGGTREDKDEPEKTRGILPTRKVILIGLLLLFIGGVVYWLSGSTWGPRNCMYWVQDHYEPASCGKPGAIPEDVDVLNNFKKITRPDTITEASIGKVYYLRRHGGHEYYTKDGDVPDDPNLRLLRLSRFIYENHILPLKK